MTSSGFLLCLLRTLYALIFYCVCMDLLPACMFTCVLCLWRPGEGIRSPKTGVTDGCLTLCGSLESNPGPLEDQPGLLAVESSLQSPIIFL